MEISSRRANLGPDQFAKTPQNDKTRSGSAVAGFGVDPSLSRLDLEEHVVTYRWTNPQYRTRH